MNSRDTVAWIGTVRDPGVSARNNTTLFSEHRYRRASRRVLRTGDRFGNCVVARFQVLSVLPGVSGATRACNPQQEITALLTRLI